MTAVPASHPHTPAQPPRATRREWTGLAVIALPCLVYAMDLTVLNLAMPAISEQLRPSAAQLLWMIDIYGFMVAGWLITMGTLGDRVGRRRMLLIGAAAFAVASAIAAFSRSAESLIAARALLGVAGATLAPSTMSLIRNMFHHERERQFAIGVWIASFSAGAAVGPLVGGLLLAAFHWSAIFLVAVPVMLLVLVLGPRLLPEYRDPNAHHAPLDLASVALSLGAVLTTIYALKHLAEHGLAAGPAALLGVGLLLGTAFARRQRGLAYPLMDLTLFRNRTFAAALSAYALTGLAGFGISFFITQHLQLVMGLSALHAGLVMLPWSLCFVVGSLLSPRLARAMPRRTLMGGGLLVSALGLVLVALLDAVPGVPTLALLVAGTVLMSLGMAPVVTVGNEMIITAAPPERAGAASALSETSAEFSGALGIALFGSLGTVVYRAALDESLPPGLADNLATDALATLGGAVAAAGELPVAAGTALLHAAREAYAEALRLMAWAAAAVVGLTCVITVALLKPADAGR